MNSPSSRISNLALLHPIFRDKVQKVIAQLAVGNHPFEPFETYRTPERQNWLFAQGRTRPGGKVTNAQAWGSYHQYGLAVDFVLKLGGNWSWDTTGTNAAHWKALHAIAEEFGLEPLSFELPHLQLKGQNVAALKAGDYPAFGDDDWAENFAAAIQDWNGGGAPPPPVLQGRPAIAASDPVLTSPQLSLPASEPEDDLQRSAIPSADSGVSAMSTQSSFEVIQSMIDKWEGGYVDHPSDPGGATNMGITLATLSRWRGRAVTKAEVKALTRTEQRQIMKAYYYNVISGDLLDPPVCAVTYNAAILHGPGRAAKFLQSVIAASDPTVKIDGAIGPATLAAARALPSAQLVDGFIATELAYLKGLSHWPTFGRGWENRLNDIRTFAHGLEPTVGTPMFDLPSLEVDRTGSVTGAGSVIDTGTGTGPIQQPNGVLGLDNLLGQTIGNALSGKKTAIGGIGTLLAILGPTLGKAFNIDTAQFNQIVDVIQPLSVAMLSWGVGAKIDKLFGGILRLRR